MTDRVYGEADDFMNQEWVQSVIARQNEQRYVENGFTASVDYTNDEVTIDPGRALVSWTDADGFNRARIVERDTATTKAIADSSGRNTVWVSTKTNTVDTDPVAITVQTSGSPPSDPFGDGSDTASTYLGKFDAGASETSLSERQDWPKLEANGLDAHGPVDFFGNKLNHVARLDNAGDPLTVADQLDVDDEVLRLIAQYDQGGLLVDAPATIQHDGSEKAVKFARDGTTYLELTTKVVAHTDVQLPTGNALQDESATDRLGLGSNTTVLRNPGGGKAFESNAGNDLNAVITGSTYDFGIFDLQQSGRAVEYTASSSVGDFSLLGANLQAEEDVYFRAPGDPTDSYVEHHVAADGTWDVRRYQNGSQANATVALHDGGDIARKIVGTTAGYAFDAGTRLDFDGNTQTHGDGSRWTVDTSAGGFQHNQQGGHGRVFQTWNAYYDGTDWRSQQAGEPNVGLGFANSDPGPGNGLNIAASSGTANADDVIDWHEKARFESDEVRFIDNKVVQESDGAMQYAMTVPTGSATAIKHAESTSAGTPEAQLFNDGTRVQDWNAQEDESRVYTALNMRDNPVTNKGGWLGASLSTTQTDVEGGVNVAVFGSINNDESSWYTKDSASQITFDEAGKYRVHFSVNFVRPSDSNSTGGRNVMRAFPKLSGTNVGRAVATTYLRNDGDGNESSAANEVIVNASAGDTLVVYADEKKGGESGNDIIDANVVIERVA